jgi:hypothetical protein
MCNCVLTCPAAPFVPLVLLVASCASREAGEGRALYTSPAAAFDAYRDARANGDWRACFLCLSDKARADVIFAFVFAGAESGSNERRAIVQRYLSGAPGKGRVLGDSGALLGPGAAKTPGRDAVRDRLAARVKDMAGFFEAIGKYDAEHFGSPPPLGELEQLVVRGDIAAGRALTTCIRYESHDAGPPQKIEEKVRRTFLFKRRNGGWLLDAPPLPETDAQYQFRRKAIDKGQDADAPRPPLPTADRAKGLQAGVESLWVQLACSEGEAPSKPYGELRLSVRPVVYESRDPNVHLARLTETEGKRLVQYLATEGFLQRAVQLGKQAIPPRSLAENCYTLQVSVPNFCLHEDFGWGPGMLKRLDGLRGALDGEAARAMDAVLAGLADERKKWAAEEKGGTSPVPPAKEAR